MEENKINENNEILSSPEEGDYCKYYFEIIKKMPSGQIICDVCYTKCPHSKNKERNYLVKKKKA